MTHIDLTSIIPDTEWPLVKIDVLPHLYHSLQLEVQGSSWKRGPS